MITLLGVALLAVVPAVLVLPLALLVVVNIAGAIGDIVVALWLLRYERIALVEDTGDAVTVYSTHS